MPDQDVAQGSYIALPLTLLLLLAAYNHEKVVQYLPQMMRLSNKYRIHLIAFVCVCVLQVIPLLLQLVNRIQGVRSIAQAGGDSAALDEAKRQAKRQKARRT